MARLRLWPLISPLRATFPVTEKLAKGNRRRGGAALDALHDLKLNRCNKPTTPDP
jgi:hypothetical protein